MKAPAFLFQPRVGTQRAVFLDDAKAVEHAMRYAGDVIPLGPIDPEQWSKLWKEYREAVEARHALQRERESILRLLAEAVTLAPAGSHVAIKLQGIITTFTP